MARVTMTPRAEVVTRFVTADEVGITGVMKVLTVSWVLLLMAVVSVIKKRGSSY